MSSCSSSTINQIPRSYTRIDVQDQMTDYVYIPRLYSEDEILKFELDLPEHRALLVPSSTLSGPPNYDYAGTFSWTPMSSILTGDPQQFQPRQQQPPLRHPLPSFPGIHHQESVGVPNVDHTDFNRHGEYRPIHPYLPSTGPVSRMRAEPITVPSALCRQHATRTSHRPGFQTGEPGQPYHTLFNQNPISGYRSPEKPLVELQYHRDQISGRSSRSASGPLDFSQVNVPQPQEVATKDVVCDSRLANGPLDFLQVNTPQPQEVATGDVVLEERRSVPPFQMLEWQPFILSPTESQPESATLSSTTSTSTSASDGSGSASEALSSPPTSPDLPSPSPLIYFPSALPSSSLSPRLPKRKRAEDESTPSSSKPVKKAKQKVKKSGTTAKLGKKRAVYDHHPYNPSAPRSQQTWNICTGQKEDPECWGERVRDDSNNYFVHSAPLTRRFRLSPSATLCTPSLSSVTVAPERPDLFRFSTTSSITLNLFGDHYLKENTHKPTKQELQALFDGLSEKEKKAWAQRRREKLASMKDATA